MNYPFFVRERFKISPLGGFPGLALTLHHATTGLVGEAIELAFAPTRELFIKECGDYEFYLEALIQNLPVRAGNMVSQWTLLRETSIPDLYEILIAKSGDMLDLTKKMWIYEQAIDLELLWAYVDQCRMVLDHIYERSGLIRDFVINKNIDKLLKRYPTGYSNEAAQARADGEEQRHPEALP